MTPIAKNIIDDAITAMGIKDFGKAKPLGRSL